MVVGKYPRGTKGDVWSVGDGRKIRLFRDAWIPGRYETRLVNHPIIQDQANTTLEEWIDLVSKNWLVAKVRDAVNEEEAHSILPVPIPLVRREDQLRWPYERGGRITVRSAYHRIRAHEGQSNDTTKGGVTEGQT